MPQEDIQKKQHDPNSWLRTSKAELTDQVMKLVREEFGDEEDGDENQEIIDEEELQYLNEMKDIKREYRVSYDQMKEAKAEIVY